MDLPKPDSADGNWLSNAILELKEAALNERGDSGE
jgi:hypothetical protein